jgi:hypothetical protein
VVFIHTVSRKFRMAGPMGEGGVRYWVVRSDWVGVDGEGGGIKGGCPVIMCFACPVSLPMYINQTLGIHPKTETVDLVLLQGEQFSLLSNF